MGGGGTLQHFENGFGIKEVDPLRLIHPTTTLKFDETKDMGLQPTKAQSPECCQGGIGGKGNRTDKHCLEAGTR